MLKVGSRESVLAVKQAEIVIAAIKQYAPSVETLLVTMKTTGDIILDKTLDKIGGKGLFVKELDAALLGGRVDITVHSLKDMPMETHEGLPISAVSAREDPRDALILPLEISDACEIDFSKPIGCSSARRSLQLREIFPNCIIKPIRGNVLTRLEKLDSGEYSATVLAVAGLKRLGLTERISRIFSTEEMLPAAGQGVIAVQARAGFDTGFLTGFCSAESLDMSTAERSFVRALNGGCSSPIAAYAEIGRDKTLLTLRGMYVDAALKIHRGSISGDRADGIKLGRELALRLIMD